VGSAIVDVAVGMSLLFFVLSATAAAMTAGFASLLQLRARMLQRRIVSMVAGRHHLDEGGLDIVRGLYSHPLTIGYSHGNVPPEYLDSRWFSSALFDVTGLLEATSDKSDDPTRAEATRANVEDRLAELRSEHLRATLITIWRSCNHDLTEFRAGIERWFDGGLTLVSRDYKRRTRVIMFVVGLTIATAFNVGAVGVATELWRSDSVRDALMAQAEQQDDAASRADALDQLKDLEFPFGWSEAQRPDGSDRWILAVSGWLATAFAITFGAQFWFDTLGRFAPGARG
jgi:hypothetical protein